jgi:DNA-directed RNA polymerase subunit RPC12/RpoP
MKFTSFDDHRRPDGGVDWDSYRAAQRRNGERCIDCGGSILFGSGHPEKCGDCKSVDEPGELRHDRFIRCPYCGNKERVADTEQYHLYEEGEHEVVCSECDKDFEITTLVSFRFTSPAMEDHHE